MPKKSSSQKRQGIRAEEAVVIDCVGGLSGCWWSLRRVVFDRQLVTLKGECVEGKENDGNAAGTMAADAAGTGVGQGGGGLWTG